MDTGDFLQGASFKKLAKASENDEQNFLTLPFKQYLLSVTFILEFRHLVSKESSLIEVIYTRGRLLFLQRDSICKACSSHYTGKNVREICS